MENSPFEFYIKEEKIDHDPNDYNDYNNNSQSSNSFETNTYNSDLIVDNVSNEEVKMNIDNFNTNKRELINKKNLLNYCGITDPCKFLRVI
jgi:hypothetical protein